MNGNDKTKSAIADSDIVDLTVLRKNRMGGSGLHRFGGEDDLDVEPFIYLADSDPFEDFDSIATASASLDEAAAFLISNKIR